MTFFVCVGGLILWGCGLVMFTSEPTRGLAALALMITGAVFLGTALVVSEIRNRVAPPADRSDLELLRKCLEECQACRAGLAEPIDGVPRVQTPAG